VCCCALGRPSFFWPIAFPLRLQMATSSVARVPCFASIVCPVMRTQTNCVAKCVAIEFLCGTFPPLSPVYYNTKTLACRIYVLCMAATHAIVCLYQPAHPSPHVVAQQCRHLHKQASGTTVECRCTYNCSVSFGCMTKSCPHCHACLWIAEHFV
jgi:hypothetical protein